MLLFVRWELSQQRSIGELVSESVLVRHMAPATGLVIRDERRLERMDWTVRTQAEGPVWTWKGKEYHT